MALSNDAIGRILAARAEELFFQTYWPWPTIVWDRSSELPYGDEITTIVLSTDPSVYDVAADGTFTDSPDDLDNTDVLLQINQRKGVKFQFSDIEMRQLRPSVVDQQVARGTRKLTDTITAYLKTAFEAGDTAKTDLSQTLANYLDMTKRGETIANKLFTLAPDADTAFWPPESRFAIMSPYDYRALARYQGSIGDRIVDAATNLNAWRNAEPTSRVADFTVLVDPSITADSGAAAKTDVNPVYLGARSRGLMYAQQIQATESFRPHDYYGVYIRGLMVYGAKAFDASMNYSFKTDLT